MIFGGGYKSWAQVCTGKKRSNSGKKKVMHGDEPEPSFMV
jgi:hypothetical protein